MISQDKLAAAAIIASAGVLTAMWICKDLIMATVAIPAPIGHWGRNRWRRVIRREDYVGRHRV